MTTDIPIMQIKHQSQTSTPVRGDSTIMDDPVMTMDGSALMAGPTTVLESLPMAIDSKPPRLIIKKNR